MLSKNNRKKIPEIKDLARKEITVVNRSLETETRMLFDRELKTAGQYQGYDIASSGKIVFPHESETI